MVLFSRYLDQIVHVQDLVLLYARVFSLQRGMASTTPFAFLAIDCLILCCVFQQNSGATS